MDWIQGQNFERLADLIFSPNEKARDDYDKVENTFNIGKIHSDSIIYTHTMYIKELFEILVHIFGNVQSNLVVITHNSDINIDDSFDIPNCVTKWYSTNVNYNHPKLESIPIGIENDRWMKKVDKKALMLSQLKKEHRVRNMVYLNHNISTNPLKRLKLYQMFEHMSWVTSERGKNGNDFEHYVSQIYNHQFMFCPEGNGIDTHRLWECLYMGCIPIVKKNINNMFYEDMPICFVDDWDEITFPFLRDEYIRIKSEWWEKSKLNQMYWDNKIKYSRL